MPKKKSTSGIMGVCFEPYVGPWDASGPVLYNAYDLATVTSLCKTVATSFQHIHTYGQGTFVWDDKPRIQDSNKWNIEAAHAAGLKVSAGCYQQGANPSGDSLSIDWTKTEIDHAVYQAQKYGNVTDIIVGNECIWGPTSTGEISYLIDYAKKERDAAGYSSSTLPVTTCQEMGVLCGVNNMTPNYGPTQRAIKALLQNCESYVYANAYAYFDATIASKLGTSPDQKKFTKVVSESMTNQLNALMAAFNVQGIALVPRIGETGWPTRGKQAGQPDASLATVAYAHWYYEAMVKWTVSSVIDGYIFEAYDEPWKGDKSGDNSEAHFGIWTAQGTSSSRSQYTLTGEDEKYTPKANRRRRKEDKNLGWMKP